MMQCMLNVGAGTIYKFIDGQCDVGVDSRYVRHLDEPLARGFAGIQNDVIYNVS